MMRISRSTTSQRYSIGLRSGDCGDYLSKVNSLSCSRNQSEMIWALWRCIILLEVAIRKWVHCIQKGMDMVSNNTQVSCGVNNAQLVLRGPKCAKNISLTPLHHHHQPELLRQGRMDPCFHVLYAKFWPYHLNVAAEIETHQTRQRFSNLLLSNFGEPLVFCCCSPSASGFDVLCVQRWYFAYLDCNEWLFELLLPFIISNCTFSSDLWHQQGIFGHTTTAH